MKLYHYSAKPFILDPHRVYPLPKRLMKPRGLWLSVEDDTEESFGWREWCEGESFHLGALTHCTEVALQPESNILHIDNAAALLEFSQRFNRSTFCDIDWSTIAKSYHGILIAPYLNSMRLDDRVLWYYGWDCASACIWDCTKLHAVTSSVPLVDEDRLI